MGDWWRVEGYWNQDGWTSVDKLPIYGLLACSYVYLSKVSGCVGLIVKGC